MLIVQLTLAVVAVAALTFFGRGPVGLMAALGVATIDVALGTSPVPAEGGGPARDVPERGVHAGRPGGARSGLAERVAVRLARMARGDVRVLYALVCTLCALLTAAVSLDASVLLMVPLLAVLSGRFGAPFGVLFLVWSRSRTQPRSRWPRAIPRTWS